MENAQDHLYLRRCLELARLPGAAVEPNPRVGAVVVHDGRIIGEGFHQQYGGPHAEVNAVAAVKAPSLLLHSTIYVSLEPCNHQGQTPPCTGLILQHGIPRVVIGSLDANPQMQGNSVALLRAQGVEVRVHPLPAPFEEMNAHFRLCQRLQRPFITLKWAESRDGFLAGHNADGQPVSIRISDPAVSRWVHSLRAAHQAILIGRNTALIDDPGLTTRLWPGPDPVRIVWDAQLSLLSVQPKLRLLGPGRVILLNALCDAQEGHVQCLNVAGLSLDKVMALLYQECKIGSILVEGGAKTHAKFLGCGIWDELWRNIGAVNLETGVAAPELPGNLSPVKRLRWGNDIIEKYAQ